MTGPCSSGIAGAGSSRPGTRLSRPGRCTRSLYLVVEGVLEVRLQGTRRMAGSSQRLITVGAGSVLGEMSFFDSGQRVRPGTGDECGGGGRTAP